MRLLRFLCVYLLAIVVSHKGLAQDAREDNDHVKWIVSVSKQNSGSAVLVMNAVIDRGWHLYSMKMDDDGPMPTTISFAPGNYKLVGDTKEIGEPVTEYNNTFQMNITWYERSVVFTQKLRYRSPVAVKGSIDYMVCSSDLCMPGTFEFTQSLP